MLKIEIKKIPFDSVFERMNGKVTITDDYIAVPDNKFVDKRYNLYPFFNSRIPLTITTDKTDRVVKVKVQGQGASLKPNPLKETNVYLQNSQQAVLLDLEEGPNYVVVIDEATNESAYTIINCRRWVGMLYAFSQEFYNKVISVIDEQESAITNKYATRLAEPLLGKVFYLLPEVKSLQLLSIRLILKTLCEKASYEIGVREMGSALTLNTPYLVEPIKDEKELDLTRFPLLGYNEFIAGKIAHVWFPNLALIRWKAFLIYMDNLQGKSLIEISENEVVVEDNETKDRERHIFDFEKEKNFFARRRYAIDIYGIGKSVLPVHIIAPSYPMDMFVDEYNLLGNDRSTLDMNIPFDSGLTFDAETIDDKHDGYLGMSLIDRNELSPNYEHLAYDTSIYPADPNAISPLVYSKGYYCKGVEIESLNVSFSYLPKVDANYDI